MEKNIKESKKHREQNPFVISMQSLCIQKQGFQTIEKIFMLVT